FLLKDDLLDESGAAAAVFLGPGQPGPSGVIELFVPCLEALPYCVVAAGLGVLAPGKRLRTIGFEPFPHVHPISVLLSAPGKIHVFRNSPVPKFVSMLRGVLRPADKTSTS